MSWLSIMSKISLSAASQLLQEATLQTSCKIPLTAEVSETGSQQIEDTLHDSMIDLAEG